METTTLPHLEGQPVLSTFTAGNMATRLSRPRQSRNFNGMISAQWTEDEARGLLEAADFDSAPVMEGLRVVGWIKRKNLSGSRRVDRRMTPLAESAFVSESSGMEAVFEPLRQKGWVFTVSATGISGFIVPSDVGRYVVRAHLFTLIAPVEVLCGHLIREFGSYATCESLLQGRDIRERFQSDKNRGFDPHPVEYLNLRDLVQPLKDVAMQFPRIHENAQFWSDLDFVVNNRNDVMHPIRPMRDKSNPVQRAKETCLAARRVRATLEGVIASL